MSDYLLDKLYGDTAQVQNGKAGFGTGRLIARNLVLTAAHVIWRDERSRFPIEENWRVRLARDRPPGAGPGQWPYRCGNKVVWHDDTMDLALIEIVNPPAPLEPCYKLHVATIFTNADHSVEACGYPSAARDSDYQYIDLTPARGDLFAAASDKPFLLGLRYCELPDDPRSGWPGFSGSTVMLREGLDDRRIWVYGIVKAIPAKFERKFKVARLADAWQDPVFREHLCRGGVDDHDVIDPRRDIAIFRMAVPLESVDARDASVLHEIVKAYGREGEVSLAERHVADEQAAKIADQLNFTRDALRTFLITLGDQDVATELLPEKLAEIANQFLHTRDRLNALDSSDPLVREQLERASLAVNQGDFDTAENALTEVELLELDAANHAEAIARLAGAAAHVRRQSAADARRSLGELSLTQLRYGDAAQHFKAAAQLTPESETRRRRLLDERYADARFREGDERGEKAAILDAIATTTKLLRQVRGPSQESHRAHIQGSLAVYQRKLGEREVGSRRLHEAVASCGAALLVCTRERDPGGWAGLQCNLGEALQALGEREADAAHLNEAVTAYSAALEVATREASPLEWARIQGLLGSTLRVLGEREASTEHLYAAEAAFRQALEERPRDTGPLAWSWLQDALGSTLRGIGERKRHPKYLIRAEAAFRSALEVRTRERVPLHWAASMGGLGLVLTIRGEREAGSVRLEEAVETLRGALEERDRGRDTPGWGWLQGSLGRALQALGDRRSDRADLDRAITAYRLALQVRTRKQTPLEWAAIQGRLGSALRVLGELERGDRHLKEAEHAFCEALTVRTRTVTPLGWAWLHDALGSTKRVLGERQISSDCLQSAEEAFRAALLERTRSRVPLDWAASLGGLGLVLLVRGERETDVARLKKAVSCFRLAMRERTRERDAPGWGWMQGCLGRALQALGDRSGHDGLLRQAVVAYENAREERTRIKFPADYAWIEARIGSTLGLLGERESGCNHLETGISAFESALRQSSKEAMPITWAWIQDALGSARRKLGEQRNELVLIRDAASHFAAALTVRTRRQLPVDWAASTIGQAQTFVALGQLCRELEPLHKASNLLGNAAVVINAMPHPYYQALIAQTSRRIEGLIDSWNCPKDRNRVPGNSADLAVFDGV